MVNAFDLFGWLSKKDRKRLVLAQNKERGKATENMAVLYYSGSGYEVERTGKGSDFRVRRRNPWTGRVEKTELREVKSGSARVSKLQTRTKKRTRNYKVDRFGSFF